MARLRYLAAVAKDPSSLAQFYMDGLGMAELVRSNDGDVSLSDGYFNFILERDTSQKAAQLAQNQVAVADRPAIRPYAELRMVDPEDNGFDLTQRKDWEVDVDKWKTLD